MPDHNYLANLLWQIADLLRGPYRPPQYERVMLPMTVLRRFDCVLAPTKPKVLEEFDRRKSKFEGEALESWLNRAAGQRFHNRSKLDFRKLKGDPDDIEGHLGSYIKGFSKNVRDIFEFFEFEIEIEKMREANILYLVVSKFADMDLHPAAVPNEQMGLIFENLIRRFNELANETAGDHFTPREVIRLMVSILFIEDDELLATPGAVRKLLDPACGTGGMLAEAQNYLREHHGAARLFVYGQDYNKRAFATAASDMLMKQVDHNGGGDNIRFGDSLIEDRFDGERFDYFLTNPPFGVDWKKQQKEIRQEHDQRGLDGRFGAGLPRVNDGSLLFLEHMWDKREPVRLKEHKHGSRLAVVFSGSPLFAGGAGSGESNIRKWLIENDWLEAIVALPEQMFYNTGIGTYVWIVTNRKEKRRRGRVQLVDARDMWKPGGSAESKRSLGDKRRHIAAHQIEEIVRLYGRFEVNDHSKIFDNTDFGYTRVTVERPLRLRYRMTTEDKARFLDACPHMLDDVQAVDKALGREPMRDWNGVWRDIENLLRANGSRWKATECSLFRSVFTEKGPDAEPVVKAKRKGDLEADSEFRDFENVPLKDDIDDYFEREVRPHVPDAWMDRGKDRTGYEINFNRHFYKYTPPRPLAEVDSELKRAEEEIVRLLLAKKRRTHITRPVIRGVDLDVSYSDSGVPWFGELPAHWKLVPLRFVVDMIGGATPDTGRTAYWGGDTPWVSPKDMKQDEISDTESHVNALALSETALQVVPPEAVLVVVRGMILAHSFPVAVTTNFVTINQDMKALICHDVLNPLFLREFLRASKNYLVSMMDLSAHGTKKLETDVLGKLQVPLPPPDEQQEIVARIASDTDRHDLLHTATAHAMDLLKERRASLIAAAVTGKI